MAKSLHAPRYKHLPALLIRLRQDADLTQRDLAKTLKIGQSIVHKSEIGERRVDITEFMDWCIACNVDPEKAFKELRQLRGI